MSVDLTELRDSARQVMSGTGRAAPEEKLWPLVTELGWLLIGVPEELGGLGQGLEAACALYAELGAGLATVPYLSAMLAIDAVCESDLSNKEEWIERLTTGDYVAVALADSVLAITDETVSGIMGAVPSADKASHALIAAPEIAALVPLADVEITARKTWDTTRRLFDVCLKNVALDPALILARGSEAKALAARIATRRDFALAADAVGGASALLKMTVEYLQTRRQFGRPLVLFQALKHRCADLKVIIAAAEALLLDSLAQSGAEDPENLGKQAKSLACRVYARVAEEALQLHGGIGMTAEHPCHLFMKRALLDVHLGRAAGAYDLDIAAALLEGD